MSTEPSALARNDTPVSFVLDADSTPGLLPRVLQPFARRDLVPDGLWSCRSGALLRVEITIAAVAADELDRIEGNLHQIVGVRQVTRSRAAQLA